MKAKSLKKHKRRGINTPAPVLIQASVAQLSYIDSLLETTTLPTKDVNELIIKAKTGISEGEAENIITHLIDNQRDNIDGGYNYNQGDILKKLSKFI